MKGTYIKRPLRSILNREALLFAKYTVEERALPNLVDGLKPVQRYFLYSVIENAKNSHKKVAAVSGRVSEYGYSHGETSAADAGALMANTWNNNLPIIEGDGNFGSRMVKEASAARYVFCKLHENYHKYFKDEDLAPKNIDPEIFTPNHYLPTIPYVLVNGVHGIATGFRTDIPSYDPESVVECVKSVLKTGDCFEPRIKIPEFSGEIVESEDECYMLGKYEVIGKTKLIITEIPQHFDRESYVKLLDKLSEKGTIVRYEDQCGEDDFQFEVTLKRDFDSEKIIDTFKLRENIIRSIICVYNKEVKVYQSAKDLIKEFVHIRSAFVQKRIENENEKTSRSLALAEAKISFINMILSDEISLKGLTRKQAIAKIESFENLVDFSEELIKMNIYHLTTDEISKLSKDVTRLKKEMKHWNSTTPVKEYLKDLE